MNGPHTVREMGPARYALQARLGERRRAGAQPVRKRVPAAGVADRTALRCACGGGCPRCAAANRLRTLGLEHTEKRIRTADGGPAPDGQADPVSGPPAGEAARLDDAGACVPEVVRFDVPSGILDATVHDNELSAPFTMEADFSADPAPCNGECGEYRQFISGFFWINGEREDLDLCGKKLKLREPQEDCRTAGIAYKYGYHSIVFEGSEFTDPDQDTGFSFRGEDAPGFTDLDTFASGTELRFALRFRGELVDACRQDNVLQSATWGVKGLYEVR